MSQRATAAVDMKAEPRAAADVRKWGEDVQAPERAPHAGRALHCSRGASGVWRKRGLGLRGITSGRAWAITRYSTFSVDPRRPTLFPSLLDAHRKPST